SLPSTSAVNIRRGVNTLPSRSRVECIMKKRAKWTLGSRPNGSSGLPAGSALAPASNSANGPSWPAPASAITVTAACGVSMDRRVRCDSRKLLGGAELQHEVDCLEWAVEHDAEIGAWTHLANLVAHAAGDERGLGVVQDDRVLLVEPAGGDIDLGLDQVGAERSDFVEQLAAGPVEHFALPG